MFKPVNIGKSIRVLMGTRGYTQVKLAGELRVTQQWVSSLAATKPEASIETKTLINICKVFDVKLSELIALGEE